MKIIKQLIPICLVFMLGILAGLTFKPKQFGNNAYSIYFDSYDHDMLLACINDPYCNDIGLYEDLPQRPEVKQSQVDITHCLLDDKCNDVTLSTNCFNVSLKNDVCLRHDEI